MNSGRDNKKAESLIISVARKKSILLKMVFFSWTIVVITVGIFAALTIPYQKEQLIDAMLSNGKVSFTSISQITASSLIVEDYSTVVDHCITVVNENASIIYVVITRHDGMSLVHTKKKWAQQQMDGLWRPEKDRFKGSSSGRFLHSKLVEHEVFHCTFRFMYSGVDWGYIHIGLSPDKFYSDLKTLYLRTFFTATLAITLGLLFSFFFSRKLIRPLILLHDMMRKVGEGDLSSRVEISTGDEVEDLAESFNFMTTSLMQSKTELQDAQIKLLETARRAGMAEVATGILHNVGNVLNSVNVTTSSVKEGITNLKIQNLTRLSEQLSVHQEDLAVFLTENDRGKMVPGLLAGLANHLNDERNILLEKVGQLSEFVQHIVEIVRFQQVHSKYSGVNELISMTDLVERALSVHMDDLYQYSITIVREFEPVHEIMADRHKVMQIILNLISNAYQALVDVDEEIKKITVKVSDKDEETVLVCVTDNGPGIDSDKLTSIFSYGFTTKKDGHGYGLHTSALFAKEMGGSLEAISDGPGSGASFILELPVRSKAENVTTTGH